jgi:uncharacterized protein (TIGR02611 family)
MSQPAERPERPKLIERLLARREHHQTRSRAYRIGWGILGGLVLLAGVVMLITPGPAFVLIPIGLAMLALEFEWAERLLGHALVQAERARLKAANTSTAQKLLGALAAVIVAAGALWLAFRYVL